ncbi:MAG: SurA N-terminal domain-containing protein [Rickettsiaceae bacterium]|nr:SurA N-terminal domain-containing protein [Rickettsiaceae bacterium]MDP4832191.1 SurA N-terminal domain-containing protein [Rickettsiaceae bacterium]MDP5021229.1 SurA N-terminal domain-containing protein [Rickettsiaceae bacterium]MDP5083197.1 SurA N-terminal domain-containing protein [Rickettsiaceae bacterium]
MKKLLALCVILFSASVLANIPDIVALVNDQPITKYDFESRKKMAITLNNIDVSDAAMERKLNSEIVNILIEEELLNQHAEKVGGAVSKDDLDEAIGTIEQRNNMPKNGMSKFLKEKNLNVESFRKQIKGELIRHNIINSLSHSVSVSQNELDVALINSNEKDFNIEAWVFTSKHATDKELEQMQQLKKRLNSCEKMDSKLYEEFADAEKFDRKLKQLPNNTQSVVLDTKTDSSSRVYKEDDKFKLVFVCKKDRAVSSGDLSKIQAFLSNKKMSHKATKFFKDLKSKAYIKVMIPN